jgi:biopolymer transport protein ExbB/TolQ
MEFSIERRAIRAARGAMQCTASFAKPRLALEPIGGTAANLLAAAEQECALSAGLAADGIRERGKLALTQIEQGAVRTMRTGTGALATVGSTAAFLGLFGTVPSRLPNRSCRHSRGASDTPFSTRRT